MQPANTFVAYLTKELDAGGSETEIFLDRLTTRTGETIETSDFATYGKGYLTVNPNGDGVDTFPEYCSFTAVDQDEKKLTGVVRGLSAKSETVIDNNKKFHPIRTTVTLSFGSHNLQDIKEYTDGAVAGEIGSASDSVAGSTKLTENLGTRPRAVAALVEQQATPNKTLKVNPFSIVAFEHIINFGGGSTPAIVNPASLNRIDLVVYDINAAALEIRSGEEQATPTVPNPEPLDIVLAKIYNRSGQSRILDRDDTNNGYIQRWFTPSVYSGISHNLKFDNGSGIIQQNGTLSHTLSFTPKLIMVNAGINGLASLREDEQSNSSLNVDSNAQNTVIPTSHGSWTPDSQMRGIERFIDEISDSVNQPAGALSTHIYGFEASRFYLEDRVINSLVVKGAISVSEQTFTITQSGADGGSILSGDAIETAIHWTAFGY